MYKLPEDLGSKYRFVSLASKRAEQLQMGALAKVSRRERKATVIAQEEVACGLIDIWDPEKADLLLEGVGEEEDE